MCLQIIHVVEDVHSSQKGNNFQYDWSRDTSSFIEQTFSPKEPTGPKNIPNSINAESTPLDYFSLFWDNTIWQLLTETNRQALHLAALKRNGYNAKHFAGKPLTMEELRAFFGLRVAIEMLVHKDCYEFYWRLKDSVICQTLGFPNTMPRDRFLAIWSSLHCVDEADPQLDKTDKIYKAQPIFNYLMKKFKEHYVPFCHLSLDEGMIPTKNRLSFKQYIKDKPICWGIKTFLLCDSENGYIVNAEVYTGKKQDPTTVVNLGVTGNLVARMTEGYAGQYYSIYTDRFYTSVQLAEYLLSEKKICLCGTAMTNRKEFPKQLVKKKNQLAKGESELLFNGSVAALVWMDKKPIYFVTSMFISSPPVHVMRYDVSQHRKIVIPAPKAVQTYNNYIGGTDRNDQTTKLQKCRRHYKWPRRLVMKFFLWAAYNAYVQMGVVNPHYPPGKRPFTFHLFIEKLCEQLVGTFQSKQSAFGRRISDASLTEKRLKIDAHHDVEKPEHATSNQRCRVCREKYLKAKKDNPTAKDKDLPKRCKTMFWCRYCMEFLCIGTPGKTAGMTGITKLNTGDRLW